MPAQRKYCGTSQILPAGYTDFDDRYSCLRKGFGVAKGKYGEAKKCRLNYHIFVICIIILVLCVAILLFWVIWTSFRQLKKDEEEDI